MLTDEQLLQSHVVRGVLERMGNGGLHKTAGAVALGVDEVTLENAVLAICTKIAAQVLKEQRIASGLASLEKTAGLSTRALVGANLAGGAMLGGLGASAGADAVDPGGSHAGPIAAGALGGLAAVPGGAVLGGALGYAGGSAAKLLGIPGAQAMPVFGALGGAVMGASQLPYAAGEYIGEKTAANPFTAVANRIRGSAKTVPHMAPPPAAAAPIAEGADAVVRGMSPGRMGFAGKVTGAGAGAQVNPGVKSSIPTYMDSYTPQHIPHNPNKAVEVAAASGAPKAKSKATVEGADVGELPSMFRLDPSAGQTTLAPSARKGGAGILREGGGVAAAQPMSFGRGQVSDQAAPMFNLQEMMARGGKTAAILDRIFAA